MFAIARSTPKKLRFMAQYYGNLVHKYIEAPQRCTNRRQGDCWGVRRLATTWSTRCGRSAERGTDSLFKYVAILAECYTLEGHPRFVIYHR